MIPNSDLLNELVEELIVDFNIPPYCKKEALENYIKEGDDYLERIVFNINYSTDLTARSLLKNYANYAFFHITNDFFENYAKTIVSWEVSKIDENKQ